MPYRRMVLASGELYHVFNRGVARQPIFHSKSDYQRFIDLVNYYRFVEANLSFSAYKKLKLEDKVQIESRLKQSNNIHIEILAFCLMPNHFHLLLKQVSEAGISIFMRKLQNAYAKFFNSKNDRTGSLWDSEFKAVRIESDEQLLHLSRYIHLNPSTSFIVSAQELIKYPWSSLSDYYGSTSFEFVDKKFILSFFNPQQLYKEFVLNQAESQIQLQKIKHLTLE